jgi:hydrogenase-1 operon protein HyaE
MSSPLIEELIAGQGLPLVDEASLEAFAQSHPQVLLFFTENPLQFPESNDVAVVLPLLMQHFGDRFRVGVVARQSERQLHARFPFDGWPSLVLLSEGRYVGAISRMQDWDVYLSEMERLLNSEPSSMTGFKIPVVSADSTPTCH